MVSDKTDRIVIRCSPETRRRWRRLAALMDTDYEDALNKLMDMYEKSRGVRIAW